MKLPENNSVSLEMVKRDSSTYDELPYDIVKLPSKGKLYSIDHPLHGKEVVEFKAMMAPEEDILATPALLKQGTVLNVLMKSCLLDKQIDPLSLLIGDKSAILLAIRISGFGPEYKIETRCPSCKKSFPHEFNLSKIELKNLGVKPVEEGKNLFEFTLPHKKNKVLFSLATDGDDLEVLRIQEARKEKLKIPLPHDTTITDRLKLSIKSIDGKTDGEFISAFVDTKMIAKDSRALRKYMQKIEPDMIMKQVVKCLHCGQTKDHQIYMATEFFWPENGD